MQTVLCHFCCQLDQIEVNPILLVVLKAFNMSIHTAEMYQRLGEHCYRSPIMLNFVFMLHMSFFKKNRIVIWSPLSACCEYFASYLCCTNLFCRKSGQFVLSFCHFLVNKNQFPLLSWYFTTVLPHLWPIYQWKVTIQLSPSATVL